MISKILRLMLVVSIAVIVMVVGYLFRDQRYYSHVVIDAPSGLTLTFLQNGTLSSDSCRTLTDTIVSVGLAKCPECSIRMQECPSELTNDLLALHSEEPLAIPSARLESGSIAYVHTDPNVALETCVGSQRQVEKNNSKLIGFACYPPKVSRPYLYGHKLSESNFEGLIRHFSQIIAILCISLAVYLAMQFLSVRNPTETVLVSRHIHVEFKISNLIKRISDVLVSIALLVILFPFLVLFSVLLFIFEGYPIFYVSKRHVSVGQPATIIKFRTMVRDAASPKYRLRERYMRDGYLDIPLTCEVYTPIGRFLERTQLVELFQLFNILFHGMSLIGNRPLPRSNLDLLGRFDGWEERFDSPAGLTGLSQVVGKLNQTPMERLELERGYSAVYKSKSGNILICDAAIVYYTISLLLLGKPLSIEKARRLLVIASGRE